MNDKDREFEQSMNQLVHLLKKILKNVPGQMNGIPQFPAFSKDGSVNVNLCFFTFLPMSAEDFDEFVDMYDQSVSPEDREDISPDLTVSDLEFLKRHGIRF